VAEPVTPRAFVGWMALCVNWRYNPTMEHPLISSRVEVLNGKPCVKGTRVSVALILAELAAGETVADIVETYPVVTREDVQAAIAFAIAQVETADVAAE
jgi:uncharacterized protein (DUF433 family)